MKLYSDEEANYLCRDYRDIPFELRQMLFDKILDDNHISQFNPSGKKKRDYSTPANINLFSEAVGNNYGIDSTIYRKQYNKMYDKNVKNKYNKEMEDRKRDDDLAKYENILAMLRNPKGEFKMNEEMIEVDLNKMYSKSIIHDMNGNVIDIEKEFVNDAMDRAVNAISKITERKTSKGVDTSIEEIGIADMDIVDKDFTTLASIGQIKRRQREKEARENIAGVEEYKNEEYEI